MLENLKTQGDLHVARKIFHFFSILFIFLCMVFLERELCWKIYFFLGIPLVALDYFRRFNPTVNNFLIKMMGPILRKHEAHKMTGSSFTIIGLGIVYATFSNPVSQLSALFLAIGDPVASYFGLAFGKTRIWRNKSWVGFFAGTIACTIAAMIYLGLNSNIHLVYGSLFFTSVVCGISGGMAEMIPIGKLDDNFSQPLLTALLLSIVSHFLLSGGHF